MSEFLEKAQKRGKIKPLQEAFKKYPVEEEYHKGKVENIYQELIRLHNFDIIV